MLTDNGTVTLGSTAATPVTLNANVNVPADEDAEPQRSDDHQRGAVDELHEQPHTRSQRLADSREPRRLIDDERDHALANAGGLTVQSGGSFVVNVTTTINGALNLNSGASITLAATLNANGTSAINIPFTVPAAITVNVGGTMTTSTNLTVTGTLAVTGTLNANGTTLVNTTGTISGNGGAINLAGPLTVDGLVTHTGNSAVVISGTATVNSTGDLTGGGGSAATDGTLTISGNLTVDLGATHQRHQRRRSGHRYRRDGHPDPQRHDRRQQHGDERPGGRSGDRG